VPEVDLDFIRGLYDVLNSSGADFPDVLLHDYLHDDVELVEFAAAPGAATYRGSHAVADLFRNRLEAGAMLVEDLTLTGVDERTVLAAFRARMRGISSGAETSMRIWNLLTVEGSRLVRIEEFSDEAAALAAAERRHARADAP
jgi:ketosteroid isomerase-like protein